MINCVIILVSFIDTLKIIVKTENIYDPNLFTRISQLLLVYINIIFNLNNMPY